MSGPSAKDFLRTFGAAAEDGGALDVIARNAEGFAAAVAQEPDALIKAIERAAASAGGAATVTQAAFATAACRSDGRLVARDAAFAALSLPQDALGETIRASTGGGSARLSSIIDDGSGRPVALVVGSRDRAVSWPLGLEVRDALSSGGAEFGVLAVGPKEAVDWPRLFAAWTFSRAETRLAAALVRRDDLRAAAREVGVAYETARETLATAMAKMGVRRQPEFVRQLALLAFGELPANDATWKTLADAYDLTPRQGRLALLVAMGATRSTAAQSLGVSEHTAKAELKVIYERCGTPSGAALGRIVAQTDALARLASATDVEIVSSRPTGTPLRFVRRRRASGRIAVEDHGPVGAIPVVVAHTPINGRHLPRRLVAALHLRGLRPISVERPGFGLTTESAGDVVEEANADLIDVLDALGLGRVRLLGRSVIMPMSFAAAHPERVESGVLLAATPPGVRAVDGLIAAVTAMAIDHPGFVSVFARMMVRLSSERAILSLTERSVRNSPTDLAAIAEPQSRADWIRACRQSSVADGFAREMRLHADGGAIPFAALRTSWSVLIGAQDTLGAGLAGGAELWRAAAPQVRGHTVADGGRLLHLSHPDLIAEHLAR